MAELNLVDKYGAPRDVTDAELEALVEQVRQAEGRRRESFLGRWTDEQMRMAGACVIGAVMLFFMWYNHKPVEDRDAIPSQAWSFGEPGE
jgi:hypothetical protein